MPIGIPKEKFSQTPVILTIIIAQNKITSYTKEAICQPPDMGLAVDILFILGSPILLYRLVFLFYLPPGVDHYTTPPHESHEATQ